MWRAITPRSMRGRSANRSRWATSVLDRRVKRDRSRLGDLRHVGQYRLERAVILEELVQHALDIRLDVVGPAIAHPVVLVAGLHDRDAGLFASAVVGYDAGIWLEHRILRTEREDLELAVG